MNPQPEQPFDETLLDEALAQSPPEQLEAKILELTDPRMLALLDEAMAPEADDRLTQRILVATQGSMKPGTVPIPPPANDTGVLARIGPSAFRYAAAAAIVLAAGLGVWFANQEPGRTDDAPIAGAIETPGVQTPGGVTTDEATGDTTEPGWLDGDQYAVSDSLFESDLEQASDTLDDITISRDTIWSELDAYEQFLSDIES